MPHLAFEYRRKDMYKKPSQVKQMYSDITCIMQFKKKKPVPISLLLTLPESRVLSIHGYKQVSKGYKYSLERNIILNRHTP